MTVVSMLSVCALCVWSVIAYPVVLNGKISTAEVTAVLGRSTVADSAEADCVIM